MAGDDWGGSKIPRLRAQLVARDGLVCALCHQPIVGETPTIDHVLPRTLGGTDDPANLRLAHAACNSSRGARTDSTHDLGDLRWLPAPRT